ncbi:hypothetical protein GCM10009634_48660 [Saccharothrix xinjiangensis]
MPRESFAPDGLLGAARREYVFVGDHDEQRHRTLREVLSNLWIGDAFEQVANSTIAWTARFTPTGEELARLGRPPRDYYADDQDWWYSQCTTSERRWGDHGELVGEVLGIDWTCFAGTGLTERPGQSTGIPSRVYFVKNLPSSSITYRVQDLGVPDDDTVLA